MEILNFPEDSTKSDATENGGKLGIWKEALDIVVSSSHKESLLPPKRIQK